MYLLFKLLRIIKEPTLEKDDWALIADIYNKLEDKNFKKFETEYLKHRKPNGDVAEFLHHCFSIINELKDLNQHLRDPSTENDRLAIISAFLPADVNFLRLIAQKIECISRVSMKHEETNNLLRLFLLAVAWQDKRLHNPAITPLNLSLNQHQLNDVIEVIYKEMLVRKLKHLCSDYLHSIIENVGAYLKHDKLCLLYYSLGGQTIHIPSLIQSEIERIGFDVPMANPTPLLHLLFKKYIRVNELIHILNGTIKYPEDDSIRVVINADNDERLSVFANSFDYYAKTFEKRIYDATYHLFASNYTNEPLEDQFIKTCREIANTIQTSSNTLAHRY